MKRNSKKAEEIKDERPCMCEVHIKMDKERNSAIPCIGHGKGCPCTLLLEEAEKQNDGTQENVKTISESEQQA